MTENLQLSNGAPEPKAPWRDPLSMGWQAHRRILLLRLRWHTSATRGRAARLLAAAQHGER
jgi:hypothetical protein